MKAFAIARTAAALALLLSLPANAQYIGTPGNAPLTPDGPRRGLGPPSITDHVPDIRLHSDGGGIPGAGPPIDYGINPVGPRSMAAPAYLPRYGLVEGQGPRRTGRRCETPQRTCTLTRRATIGTGCTCRLTSKSRARGLVIP